MRIFVVHSYSDTEYFMSKDKADKVCEEIKLSEKEIYQQSIDNGMEPTIAEVEEVEVLE